MTKPQFWQIILWCISIPVIIASCNARSGDFRLPAVSYNLDSVVKTLPQEEVEFYRQKVEDFYEKYLIKSHFNGGILVARDGQIIFEKYHGYYDLRRKDTLTCHSAFHLASVSKTFTAMAALKLVMNHSLNLDDNLQKFFPDFPYQGITVKMLLNHRSGLPNYLYFLEENKLPKGSMASNEDILDYMVKYKPAISARPDTRFQYCNTNFSLLALIIEKASKMKYADYLEKEFFKPLGMKDTYVFDADLDQESAMPSFDNRGRFERFTYLDRGVGDKNVYSTPEDLLKWDQALYPGNLFSEEILEEAFTPYSHEHPGVNNYGLGWRMKDYPDGRKIIYHNGWWHGNNTVFVRDVQNGVTIIVLGNRYNKNIYLSSKMLDFLSQDMIVESH